MRRLLVPVVAVVAVLGAVSGCSSTDDAVRKVERSTDEISRVVRAELPTPRTEVAGAAFDDGTIIVVGGLTADGKASDLVHLHDGDADEWTEGPRLPAPVHHTQVVAARGRVYVVGGFAAAEGNEWVESAAVWSIGRNDTEWRPEPPLTSPRGALGAAATEDGTIVAFGGVSRGTVTATTEVLRPQATTWEKGPDMSEPREHLAATNIDGRIFAIAGRAGSLESNKRTVESWDPSGREGSWRREPHLVEARGGIAAAGRCVAGGEEPTGTIGTIECLGPDRDGGERAWRTITSMRQARHGLAVIAIGDRLHIISGGDKPGLFVTGTHEVILGAKADG
ncbi:MAG TPA: hypothetical protein VM345_13055 [Acidimicrobiales bacterium]|nr:hypothetical protein [Acidimicrobiales bacterium]